MIFEVANLNVREGQNAAFEAAFADVSRQFAGLSHYIAHELQRSLETNRYTLFLVLENEHDKGKFVTEFSALGTGLEPFLESPPGFESFKRAFLSETGNE